MTKSFSDRPDEYEQERTVKITFEGENAYVAFMATVPTMMQAVFQYVQKVELLAQQLGNVPNLPTQVPQLLPAPETVPQTNGRPHGR